MVRETLRGASLRVHEVNVRVSGEHAIEGQDAAARGPADSSRGRLLVRQLRRVLAVRVRNPDFRVARARGLKGNAATVGREPWLELPAFREPSLRPLR